MHICTEKTVKCLFCTKILHDPSRQVDNNLKPARTMRGLTMFLVSCASVWDIPRKTCQSPTPVSWTRKVKEWRWTRKTAAFILGHPCSSMQGRQSAAKASTGVPQLLCCLSVRQIERESEGLSQVSNSWLPLWQNPQHLDHLLSLLVSKEELVVG